MVMEFFDPGEFESHPDNRPAGMNSANIDTLSKSMQESGYHPAHPVVYCIADETWPDEYKHLIGKKVLLGGHHRREAAVKAGIKQIPAVLDQKTYEASLKFLDDDNQYTPLHWVERTMLHEKRRELMGLTLVAYGQLLGYKATKTIRGSENAYRTVKSALDFFKETGLTISDFNFGYHSALAIKSTAPKEHWTQICKTVSSGSLPAKATKLRAALKEMFSPEKVHKVEDKRLWAYLYVAKSTQTTALKCGVTTEPPSEYIRKQSGSTWAFNHTLVYSVEIPIEYKNAADKSMKDALQKFIIEKEFYGCSAAKAIDILDQCHKLYSEDKTNVVILADEAKTKGKKVS